MLFKLLAGGHQELVDGKRVNYRKGDEFESDLDLVAEFGKDKFQRLYDKEALVEAQKPKTRKTAVKKTKSDDSDDSEAGQEKEPETTKDTQGKQKVKLKKKDKSDGDSDDK